MTLLLGNLWRAAFIAALGIIAALSAYIYGVPIIGGGLLAKLESARVELKSARDDLDSLKAESDRRKANADKALQEAQERRPVVDSQIADIRAQRPSGGPVEGCETSPAVLGADL